MRHFSSLRSFFNISQSDTMIYTSSYPERVYPDDLSTYKLLFDNKKNIAQDKVIYVDTENTSKFYTYSQTHAQVLKTIAGWKREFNFKKGDVVAFCSINHIDYPIALIGTVCAGK
jgi:4-coumarate--CoA ligase